MSQRKLRKKNRLNNKDNGSLFVGDDQAYKHFHSLLREKGRSV